MTRPARSHRATSNTCRWCGRTKHVVEFPRSANGWVMNECIPCRDERLACWAAVELAPVLAPGGRRWVDADATELVCTRCGRMRPKDGFYTFDDGTGRRYLRPKCRQCMGAEQNLRVRAQGGPSPERRRRDRDAFLRRTKGITLEEFEQMLAEQGGRCAICRTDVAGGPTQDAAFHADHCHVSNRFRGVLCRGCNTGLGAFGDDPDRLIAAAAYLISDGWVAVPRETVTS